MQLLLAGCPDTLRQMALGGETRGLMSDPIWYVPRSPQCGHSLSDEGAAGGGHAVADAELTSTQAMPQDGKGSGLGLFSTVKARKSTVEGNGGALVC